MPMDRLPLVATVESLPDAVEYGNENESARWFIMRRATVLGADDQIPEEWLESMVAAFTGDRDKAAEKGEALPDGSFPIPNLEYLRRAIRAYGRAKNKPRAKQHIISRAKALNAEKMLPNDWREKKAVAASGVQENLEADIAYIKMTYAPDDVKEFLDPLLAGLKSYSDGELEITAWADQITEALPSAYEKGVAEQLETALTASASAFKYTDILDSDAYDEVHEALTAATRRVATPEGQDFYGQPIGAVIIPNVYVPSGSVKASDLKPGMFININGEKARVKTLEESDRSASGGKKNVRIRATMVHNPRTTRAVPTSGEKAESGEEFVTSTLEHPDSKIQTWETKPKGTKAVLKKEEPATRTFPEGDWYRSQSGKGFTRNPEYAKKDADGNPVKTQTSAPKDTSHTVKQEAEKKRLSEKSTPAKVLDVVQDLRDQLEEDGIEDEPYGERVLEKIQDLEERAELGEGDEFHLHDVSTGLYNLAREMDDPNVRDMLTDARNRVDAVMENRDGFKEATAAEVKTAQAPATRGDAIVTKHGESWTVQDYRDSDAGPAKKRTTAHVFRDRASAEAKAKELNSKNVGKTSTPAVKTESKPETKPESKAPVKTPGEFTKGKQKDFPGGKAGTPGKTYADGNTPKVGDEVMHKNGRTGKVEAVYGTYAAVRYDDDGQVKSGTYGSLNSINDSAASGGEDLTSKTPSAATDSEPLGEYERYGPPGAGTTVVKTKEGWVTRSHTGRVSSTGTLYHHIRKHDSHESAIVYAKSKQGIKDSAASGGEDLTAKAPSASTPTAPKPAAVKRTKVEGKLRKSFSSDMRSTGQAYEVKRGDETVGYVEKVNYYAPKMSGRIRTGSVKTGSGWILLDADSNPIRKRGAVQSLTEDAPTLNEAQERLLQSVEPKAGSQEALSKAAKESTGNTAEIAQIQSRLDNARTMYGDDKSKWPMNAKKKEIELRKKLKDLQGKA